MTVQERVQKISLVDGNCTEDCLPVAAKVEVSGICSLNCRFCFQRTLKQSGIRQRLMTQNDFDEVLRFLKTVPTIKEVGLFYMGESALNPNLPYFYKQLKDNGYFTFLTTNGTISKTIIQSIPYVDSLKVSWNYKDFHDFEQKTGSHHAIYSQILRNINDFFKECHDNNKELTISTVLDCEKEDYSNILKSIPYDQHYWIPLQTQCGVEKHGIGGVVGESEHMRPQIPCWSLFKCIYIDSDLNLRSCCYGHHDYHVLFNIKNHDFQISDKLKQLRHSHLLGNVPVECERCITK